MQPIEGMWLKLFVRALGKDDLLRVFVNRCADLGKVPRKEALGKMKSLNGTAGFGQCNMRI